MAGPTLITRASPGEQLVQADRLKADRRGEIDIGIEIGMGGVTAMHGGADAGMGRQNIGPPRQKIGRQMLRQRQGIFHPRRQGRAISP